MVNNPGAIFVLGAAVSAWQIYDLATKTEGMSQTLALMRYFLLAIMVITTLYAGAKWFANPPRKKQR